MIANKENTFSITAGFPLDCMALLPGIQRLELRTSLHCHHLSCWNPRLYIVQTDANKPNKSLYSFTVLGLTCPKSGTAGRTDPERPVPQTFNRWGMEMRSIAILTLLTASLCFAQESADFKPATSNVLDAQFPKVDGTSRVQIRFKAPEASKVRVNFWSGPKADMEKQSDGFWT